MDYRIEAETAQEDIRNALTLMSTSRFQTDGGDVGFDENDFAAIRARLESALRKLDAPDIGPSSAPREDRAVQGVPVEVA